MVKKVAAVHDICGYGRCSLTTVISALSASGIQCCPVPTAVLSAHTAFEQVSCRDLTDDLSLFVERLAAHSKTFDAIYSGYLASPAQAQQVLRLKSLCEGAPLLLVDPVMGDNGKPYKMVSDPEYRAAMLTLCRSADVITPNITEAAILLGENPVDFNVSPESAAYCMKKLCAHGCKAVVLTGIPCDGHIGSAFYDAVSEAQGIVYRPKVPQGYPGTGDLFTSVLLCSLLHGNALSSAAAHAAEFVYLSVLKSYELQTNPIEGVLFEPLLCQIPKIIKI